jgi:hypothetical protein
MKKWLTTDNNLGPVVDGIRQPPDIYFWVAGPHRCFRSTCECTILEPWVGPEERNKYASRPTHWADGKCVLHEDKICGECIPTDVIEKYQDEIYKMDRRWI